MSVGPETARPTLDRSHRSGMQREPPQKQSPSLSAFFCDGGCVMMAPGSMIIAAREVQAQLVVDSE